MKISKHDAVDFFDHFCFIDLLEKKYYPSKKLSDRMRLDVSLTDADYASMELDTERYLRPPVRNPLYIDYTAALLTGMTNDTLIRFGYRESDAVQEFLSYKEGLFLRKYGPSRETADAMHALRDYLSETNGYNIFLSNWETVRMKTIKDWLSKYGIEVL